MKFKSMHNFTETTLQSNILFDFTRLRRLQNNLKLWFVLGSTHLTTFTMWQYHRRRSHNQEGQIPLHF